MNALIKWTRGHSYRRTSFKAFHGSRICLSDYYEPDRFVAPKGDRFYAEHALKRKYFYAFDTRGQIFLEETTPRNIATSMKDKSFINFIHKTMRSNKTDHFVETHPYVSFCGKEINYIAPADRYSSICFRDLIIDDSTQSQVLVYGDDLRHPFDVKELLYHPVTGRLYHKIFQHRYLLGQLGLLHPFLCQKLAASISFDSEKEVYSICWGNTSHLLEAP